ncbi:MAG: carboxypeptidase regulatory-like domain-containing protein [Kiritimatiellae bacterium]|nr:carboxypeptidase regulatory-like domain-containing protein [Kiritimatiellia bacterium]MCO5067179.1 carboxypeptidase-like regulatory domain-containing protein [Kiritimatiellia bacterium]
MKRLVFRIIFLLCSCLYPLSLTAATPEVDQARQRGAQGQVTLRVVDSTGKPVDKAKLSVVFWGSDSSADVVVSEGTTDTNGLFVAAGKTIHSMNYTATKEGYYKTIGRYWFYRQGADNVREGHWLPWNPTNTVVLKDVSKPIGMYAKKVETQVPNRDKPVGIDLEVGDWVVPHGEGKQPDLLFTYKAEIQDFWNGSLELRIACANKLDGFIRVDMDVQSDFRSTYEAPRSGYQPELQFAFVTTTEKDLKIEKLGDTEYLAFRVRTVLDDKGNVVSARYGKIYGPIEFGVGKQHNVRFTYYFNPTANDRNLEFDPDRNLLPADLGKRVSMP